MVELWQIDEGIEDAERFFGLVGEVLPGATHLFVEASTAAGDVEACYGRLDFMLAITLIQKRRIDSNPCIFNYTLLNLQV